MTKSEPNALSRRKLLKFASAMAAAAGAGSHHASAQEYSPAKLFHTETGTGRNVLLLHGWTCDSHDWIWQMPALESRYRVVAVDLRGHGRSEIKPRGSYTPADYVADIEDLISKQGSSKKTVVIGHSMGVQIAARLALKRPDLVEAVVSVDGSLGFSSDLVPLFETTDKDLKMKDPGEVGPALFEMFYDAATPASLKRWHARRLQGMPAHVTRESFGPLFLGPDQIGCGKASEDFCRSLTQPFYHMCRFPEQAEAMRSWFRHPKSKVDVWTGAGHWIQQDRPDDVSKAIIAWIDGLEA